MLIFTQVYEKQGKLPEIGNIPVAEALLWYLGKQI
jgi:hypothetical protein